MIFTCTSSKLARIWSFSQIFLVFIWKSSDKLCRWFIKRIGEEKIKVTPFTESYLMSAPCVTDAMSAPHVTHPMSAPKLNLLFQVHLNDEDPNLQELLQAGRGERYILKSNTQNTEIYIKYTGEVFSWRTLSSIRWIWSCLMCRWWGKF